LSRLLGSRGVRISGSNAGYGMFRGSVKSTGYPIHWSVSPSLPVPCVTVCHHISTGLYYVHRLLEYLQHFFFLKHAVYFFNVSVCVCVCVCVCKPKLFMVFFKYFFSNLESYSTSRLVI